MHTLRHVIEEAERSRTAVGHFNISDLVTLRAILEAAKELAVPVVIGTSEGERDFLGARQAAALIRSFREEHEHPIFLNADHTHSFMKAKEAVSAGYDAVLFDGSRLSWEENVAQTKAVVAHVKAANPDILVEGEIGYIGSASEVLTQLPKGAAVKPEDLTTPEQAAEFVKRTGVDLLAPAVGNVHGIVVQKGFVERLYPDRIAAIREAAGVPLVLHGGSGISEKDFVSAIRAGVRVVHINTELRIAWRRGVEAGLQAHPDEVAPYKLMPQAQEGIRRVVRKRLQLFGR